MITRRRRPRTAVNIVPLIDVMFFLVVFFMLFTTFRTEPAGLDVQLPRAATARQNVPSELVVTVREDGRFYLGGRAVTSAELQQEIRRALADRPDLLVIIRGDRRARYEQVVRAIDDVRSVGGYRLALAVRTDT
ncbi:ExbD/TolR family protein [Limnochorda pilosa]|uniref:Biopolymer transporter ExbD n=1 Tax=Limnochorda pilosa TaxID=1555112 RepID=A0A0K2SKB6_LIMPI|nr:biopolymer transporter ExbD [Limnochorda pilosa]BAS27558.1 biopolymer transporter ExbD [Limnochorda pilosa]